MVTIDTERLTLRPWQLTDAPALYQLASHPEIGPRAGWPAHAEVATSEQTLRDSLMTDLSFAIIRQDDQALIGAIALRLEQNEPIKLQRGQGDIGYWTGEPYWRQGYAREALIGLIDYAFDTLHLEEFFCNYLEGNEASANLQESVGMTPYALTIMDEPNAFYKTDRMYTNHVTCEDWSSH